MKLGIKNLSVDYRLCITSERKCSNVLLRDPNNKVTIPCNYFLCMEVSGVTMNLPQYRLSFSSFVRNRGVIS